MPITAITIIYHQESDGFWAESPNAPGFTAVAATMEELERRVKEGLRFYFESGQPASTSSALVTARLVEVPAGA